MDRLARPRRIPVLFLNGGTATGGMWETTPDGRPGWRDILLREGHDTWQVDAPGKGRASYQPFPAVLPGEPVFRPAEATWTLPRIGPCVIVAQSSGACFATLLAAKRPDLVRGIVAVELTASPDFGTADPAALARVPQLLIWGGNLGTSEYWRKTRAAAGGYAVALRERGGTAEVLDPPETAGAMAGAAGRATR